MHLGAVELRGTGGVAHDEALAGAALGQPAGDAQGCHGAGGAGHGDEFVHGESVTRSPAQCRRAESERQHDASHDDRHVEPQPPADVVGRELHEPVVGVGERHDIRDALQQLGHLLARDEQTGEQELGEDERGHELHGVKLRRRERAQEEPERHAEQRVADRQRDDRPGGPGRLDAQQPEADERGDRGLHRGEHAERDAVAREQVELAQRRRHQPLERPARALAQHGDLRDGQEDHHERNQPDERCADACEAARRLVEHVAQQRQQRRRDDEDQRERAVVAAQLGGDAGVAVVAQA